MNNTDLKNDLASIASRIDSVLADNVSLVNKAYKDGATSISIEKVALLDLMVMFINYDLRKIISDL